MQADLRDHYRFSVAPMLDCTDRHFRLQMRQITRHGLLTSEMVVVCFPQLMKGISRLILKNSM